MGRGRTCDKRAPWRYAPAVAASWQLFTDDPEERARFSDLRATLALDGEPAGPPNRLRHVVRIEVLGRRYFLKCFRKTYQRDAAFASTGSPARYRRMSDASASSDW